MRSAPQFEPRSARRRVREIILASALIAGAATFITPRANAQDLGEIARQERAKKQNNPAPSPTHVYTNDDLKREEILTPEDKSRFTAANLSAPAKPAQLPVQSTAQTAPQPAPQPVPQPVAQTMIPAAVPAIAKTTPAPAARIEPQPKVSFATVSAASAASPKSAGRAPTRSTTTPTPATAPLTANTVAPAPATAPTAQPVAAPVSTAVSVNATENTAPPTTIPLEQMPLGEIARYYRAKKRALLQAEDAEATANPVPAVPTILDAPPIFSAAADASSTANPGCVPSATLSTAQSVDTTVPAPVPAPIVTEEPTQAQLAQMPLGDVARY